MPKTTMLPRLLTALTLSVIAFPAYPVKAPVISCKFPGFNVHVYHQLLTKAVVIIPSESKFSAGGTSFRSAKKFKTRSVSIDMSKAATIRALDVRAVRKKDLLLTLELRHPASEALTEIAPTSFRGFVRFTGITRTGQIAADGFEGACLLLNGKLEPYQR